MQHEQSINCAGVVPLRKEGDEWKVFLIQYKGYEQFWGCPKGNRELNETHQEAACRELKEETGLEVKNFLQHRPLLEEFYWLKKGERLQKRILFYLAEVEGRIDLQKAEVADGRWFTLPEAIEKIIYPEGKSTLKQVEDILKISWKNRRSRSGANVNAYLILKKEDEVLLHLRKNTGYCDGMWGFVAGHVEDGESGIEGIIREAREEIGIKLYPEQIQAVHVMHRKTNRLNVDLFFDCQSWEGEIHNCEPEKCEKLAFFPLNSMPSNIVEYNLLALNHILAGRLYSELGWKE